MKGTDEAYGTTHLWTKERETSNADYSTIKAGHMSVFPASVEIDGSPELSCVLPNIRERALFHLAVDMVN